MVLPEKLVPPFTSCASPASCAAVLISYGLSAVPVPSSALVYQSVLTSLPSHASAAFSAFSRAISSSPLFSSSVGCSSLFSSSLFSPSGASSFLSSSGLLASSPSPSPGFLSSSPGLVGCSSPPCSVSLFSSSLPSVSSLGLASAGFALPSMMAVPLPPTTSVAKAAGVTSVSVSTMLISRLTMRRDTLLVRFFM